MGIIRVLLALSVAFAHLWRGDTEWPFPSASLAVQAFFMISGFYMSLILSSDVYHGRPVKFWMSRALRIYPTYWILATASALFTYVIAPETFGALWAQGSEAVAFILFANVFLIGQDLQLWLVNIGGHLAFTANSWSYPPPRLSNFMLIGPAWSLAVELMFYAIAPFLVRQRSLVLACLIATSLAARFVAYGIGLNHMPWTYMFFPFELAFFVLGVVAHRRMRAPSKHGAQWFVLLTSAICLFQFAPKVVLLGQSFNDWALLLLVFLALPHVFSWSKNSAADAALGELSYPIYLSHMVVAAAVSGFLHSQPFALVIGLTVAVSAILAFAVDRPLSKWRRQLNPGFPRLLKQA